MTLSNELCLFTENNESESNNYGIFWKGQNSALSPHYVSKTEVSS